MGHFGSTGEKRSFSLLPFTKSIFATDLTRGVERRGAGENRLAYRTVADAQLLAVLAVISRPASLHSSSADQYKTKRPGKRGWSGSSHCQNQNDCPPMIPVRVSPADAQLLAVLADTAWLTEQWSMPERWLILSPGRVG